MSIPFPTSNVARIFAEIIDIVCRIVPKMIARDRNAGDLIILIYTHLRRLGIRFAAIAARAQAGTLRATRPYAIRGAATGPALPRAPRLLPVGYAWLIMTCQETACFGQFVYNLVLNDPEMAALLAASPEAGRIVRSIMWMTAIRPLPAILRAPQRAPRKARVRAIVARAVPERAAPVAHPLARKSPPYQPSANWPPGCNTRSARPRRKARAVGPLWPD